MGGWVELINTLCMYALKHCWPQRICSTNTRYLNKHGHHTYMSYAASWSPGWFWGKGKSVAGELKKRTLLIKDPVTREWCSQSLIWKSQEGICLSSDEQNTSGLLKSGERTGKQQQDPSSSHSADTGAGTVSLGLRHLCVYNPRYTML